MLLGVALWLTAGACYTGRNESCRTSQVLGTVEKITCSGSVATVSGEGPLSFGDDDDEFQGGHRFEMSASVEQGSMDIYADTVDGGKKGGEVSPGNPLRIEALTPSTGDRISVTIKVKGDEDAEVRGLRYEATAVRVD